VLKDYLILYFQNLTTVSQDESSNEQLTVLRNHLLTLTRTEPQLQSIKDLTLDVSRNKQKISVVEVIQLWQRVFQETFQQYHRLLTRLIRTQDVVAALKLWEEYLTHVQDFLSSGVPHDYNGLSEHRNLCEIYQKLLPEQQNLMLTVRQEEDRDESVTKQFNILTNMHNETLAKIMERHSTVCSRITAWNRYRIDQGNLLTWLRDVERERQHISFQFIRLKRLDKTMERIQILLDKSPIGKTKITSLEQQQKFLLNNCTETVASSILAEHAANVHRFDNFYAALQTWRDFIQKIQKLHEQHVDKMKTINAVFQELSQLLSAAFHAEATNLSDTKKQLDLLLNYEKNLTNTKDDLKALSGITEDLRGLLNPNDIKTLDQDSTLLSQKYNDLEYQLALLKFRYKERCALYGQWKNKLEKLLLWIKDRTKKTEGDKSTSLHNFEIVKQLECGILETEILLKQREFDWLQKIGNNFMDIAEENEKSNFQRSLNEIKEKWNTLTSDIQARHDKLSELTQTANSLVKKITDTQAWLTKIEAQLLESITIEKLTQRSFRKKMEAHEELQAVIEAESCNISDLLHECDMLLRNCRTWKTHSFDIDAIKIGKNNVDKRWENICCKSSERKSNIMTICKLLKEVDRVKYEYEPWLIQTEKSLWDLENYISQISKADSKKAIENIKPIAKDIEAHQHSLRVLQRLFSNVAFYGLDPDNFRLLMKEPQNIIERWSLAEKKIVAIITSLQREGKMYYEFVCMRSTVLISLTQLDIRMTQLQHLDTPQHRSSLEKRRQQLTEMKKELDALSMSIQNADKLALEVMKQSPKDINKIKILMDEYHELWQKIAERISSVQTALKEEKESEESEDKAVQVETLKFEQDTAVQVDTLPELETIISSNSRLNEFNVALKECNKALNTLENAIMPQPILGFKFNVTHQTIVRFRLFLLSFYFSFFSFYRVKFKIVSTNALNCIAK